jgi:RNA polymerase sigma factor (sigma-70 family)
VPAPAVCEPAPDAELWALVRALPERQQRVVVLRYAGDFSYAEIARVMHISIGTVGSTLDAAHRNLRTALTTEEVGKHG